MVAFQLPAAPGGFRWAPHFPSGTLYEGYTFQAPAFVLCRACCLCRLFSLVNLFRYRLALALCISLLTSCQACRPH